MEQCPLYEKRRGSIPGLLLLSRRSRYTLPNKVAVKMFMSSQLDTFSKELVNMVTIGENSCPNIVQFFGSCTLQGGKQGLVMELFDINLMECITPPCFLTEGQSILRQIANGFRHLKELKVVHRDVKPDNILVKIDNGMIKVVLTDLGVSKHMTNTQRSNIKAEQAIVSKAW